MHSFMLFVGMGTALMAAGACRDAPTLPLTQAAGHNDADAVRRLVADKQAVDETDQSGLTALMWAARLGALDAMQSLLDAGANVNARSSNRFEWTALHHAVHRRQPAAVRLLLEHGADPNAAPHAEALTPLLMAAGDAGSAIVKLLLAHGANARYQGEWGGTPLTEAISGAPLMDIDRPLHGGCRAETVRALLAHDPTLRLPDNVQGRLALMWARLFIFAEHDPGERCADVLQLLKKS